MTQNSATTGADDGGSTDGGLKKGPWTAAEDAILMEYVKKHGEGNWNAVQKNSGLSRCGKSCRLRWANHLRPNLKKGSFSPEEERLILELHAKLGNKWARMAAQLPGRTDNEIKNYWNTRIKRRQRTGLPLYPPEIQRQAALNHHNQHRPSSSPPSSILSSSHQQKPHFSSPLPLFDPINFSSTTTPLLTHHHPHSFLPSSPIHHFKRFRDNNTGFSLPFVSPSPTNLFNHSLNNPDQNQNLSFQFSSGNLDLNPPVLLPFEPDGFPPVSSAISMKMELPSCQYSEPVSGSGVDDYKQIPASLGHSGSGLLDDLLEEAQAMVSGDVSKREGVLSEHVNEKCSFSGWVNDSVASVFSKSETTPVVSANQWDDSTSGNSSMGLKMKKEPKDEINSVDEDLSSLLDVIPPTMQGIPEWYSDSGETSNGQSGLTDDDIGLEMQHLATSLSATEHDWSLMPGIC